MKNVVTSLITIVLLSGCMGDPYEKYIGLWERQDKDAYEVMDISKDGETILMNDNILKEKNSFGGKKKSMVLKKSEGQLSIDTGFGSAQLGLSENGDTLRVANQSYKRININRLNKIKEEIKIKKEEQEKNIASCSSLIKEYSEKKEVILSSYKSSWAVSKEAKAERKVRDEKLQELKDLYKPKEKAIPNCRAWIL
jgi:hypothetical protein